MIHTVFFVALASFSLLGVLLNGVYFLVPSMMGGNIPVWHQPALALILVVQAIVCLTSVHSVWVGVSITPWALLCGLVSFLLTSLFLFWIREFKKRYRGRL